MIDNYKKKIKTLRSCPFCGSHKVHIDGVIFPYVTCDKCKAYGPVGFSKEDAADKWNAEPVTREKARDVEIVIGDQRTYER